MASPAPLLSTSQEYGLVEMIDVDLTAYGAGTYHLSPSLHTGGTFDFGGVTYSAFAITISDSEINTSGNLPRPQLTVGRVENKLLAIAMATYGDLVGGMKVTRRYTYENYLDGAVDADSSEHTYAETYTAIQVVSQTKATIVWQLATPIDLPNAIIPGTQYLKDIGTLSGPSDTSQGVTRNVYAPGLSRILSE